MRTPRHTTENEGWYSELSLHRDRINQWDQKAHKAWQERERERERERKRSSIRVLEVLCAYGALDYTCKYGKRYTAYGSGREVTQKRDEFWKS